MSNNLSRLEILISIIKNQNLVKQLNLEKQTHQLAPKFHCFQWNRSQYHLQSFAQSQSWPIGRDFSLLPTKNIVFGLVSCYKAKYNKIRENGKTFHIEEQNVEFSF